MSDRAAEDLKRSAMREMAAERLTAKIKVCMFDQYGTVVDMQKGLTDVVTPI